MSRVRLFDRLAGVLRPLLGGVHDGRLAVLLGLVAGVLADPLRLAFRHALCRAGATGQKASQETNMGLSSWYFIVNGKSSNYAVVVRRPCHAHHNWRKRLHDARIPVSPRRRSAHNLYQDVRENGSQDGAVSHPQRERRQKCTNNHHPGPLVVDIRASWPAWSRRSDALIAQYRQAGARGQVLGAAGCLAGAEPGQARATVPEFAIAPQAGDLVLPKYSFGPRPLWHALAEWVEHWRVCASTH